VLALFGDKKGIRQPVVMEGRSLLGVTAQVLRCAGMERYKTGFMEFGLLDV
jgi:hypothetical protein